MSVIELKQHLHQTIDALPENALTEVDKLLTALKIKYHVSEEPAKKRQFGFMKGIVGYMSEDFDDPLDDFAEYM